MCFPGRQVFCCCHGAGKNIFIIYVKTHFSQLITYVSVCSLTVIGQKKKWISLFTQGINEFHRTGYWLTASVYNPIHINEEAFLFHSFKFYHFLLFFLLFNSTGKQKNAKQLWQTVMTSLMM